jgi:hypothetical protein
MWLITQLIEFAIVTIKEGKFWNDFRILGTTWMSQGVAVFRRIYAEENTVLNRAFSSQLDRYPVMCMPGAAETVISILQS